MAKGSLRKRLVAAVLCVVAAIGFGGGYSIFASAANEETVEAPAHSKTLTDNHDGTYTLSLSVTGAASSKTESNKADVVVVFDLSGSMEYPTDYASDTGRYGYVRYTDGSNEYVQLYYRHDSQWGGTSYFPVPQDGYSGTVYRRYSSGWGNGYEYTEYTGPRYSQESDSPTTRLSVAQSAINELAGKMLAQNNGETDTSKANVTLSLVTFSDTAHTNIQRTATLSEFQSAISGTEANGGTNWQSALSSANGISARDGATKYTIFVSDGNPTYYGTKPDGTGRETDDNVTNSYNAAVSQLDRSDKNFYGVGVFGSVTRMRSLVTAAGADASDHYHYATNIQTLDEVFDSIIKSIKNTVGFTDVSITDGITGGTTSTVLQEGSSASNYSYTITDGTDTHKYTIVLNDNGTIKTVNGGTDPVTITDSEGNTLTLTPGEAFPAASQQSGGNSVGWDLSSLGQLLDGYTYTTSFTVWPSQNAYDTVAALDNGTASWDRVDQSQYARTQNADGTYSYSLKTNTGATLNYARQQSRTMSSLPEDVSIPEGQSSVTVGDTTYTYDSASAMYTAITKQSGSSTFDYDSSMPITVSKMDVEKQWVPKEEAPTDKSVELELYIDGKASGKTVRLNAADNWKSSVYVAPGLIDHGTTLDKGHDYTLVEKGTDYHYEFSSETAHPMLKDSATEITDSNGGDSALRATNTRRSSLNITKNVVDNSSDKSAKADQLFTYDIDMKVPDNVSESDKTLWFSIGDGKSAEVTDSGRVTGATAETKGGAQTGYYSFTSGRQVTVSIKAGENIYFTNVPTGTTYSITEETPAKGYTNTSITNNGGSSDTSTRLASGIVSAGGTTYAVGYTNTYNAVTIKADADNALKATKKVTGHDATEQFSFSLSGGDDTTRQAISYGDIIIGNATPSTTASGNIKDGGSETVGFGDVTFYKAGTYTFAADETTTTTASGWTYDVSTRDIKVTINADSDGKLTVGSVSDNNPTFTNSYAASSVTLTGDTALTATKSVNGADATEQFTFKLTADPSNPKGATIAEGGDTRTTSSSGIKAGGTETVTFGDVTFTKAGTYKFYVQETNETAPNGWSYEKTRKPITVVVTDSGQGQLAAAVTDNNPTIRNSYSTVSITTSIPVDKVLSKPVGTTGPDITDKFTFTITAGNNTAGTGVSTPMPTQTTITNSHDRSYFDDIRFVKAGDYTYTITEAGSEPGVTNDETATKTVTVRVEDTHDGHLKATVLGADGDSADSSKTTFTNTYSVTPASLALSASKTLVVPAGLTRPDVSGKYDLTLKAKDGAPIPSGATDGTVTVKNADGIGT